MCKRFIRVQGRKFRRLYYVDIKSNAYVTTHLPMEDEENSGEREYF